MPPPRPDPSQGSAQWRRPRSRVARDYFFIIGTRVLALAVNASVILLMTHLLAPRSYGVLAYVSALGMVVFTVASAWTADGFSRLGRQQLEETGTFAELSWSRLAVATPLLTLAAVAFLGAYMLRLLPKEVTLALAALALGLGAASVIQDHFTYVAEACGVSRLTALIPLVQQALMLCVLAGLYFSAHQTSPVVVGTAIALSAGASIAPAIRVARNFCLHPFRLTRSATQRLVVFSLPLIASAISTYVFRWVDVVMLRSFAGLTAVGVYAVAYQGFTAFHQIATAALPIARPLLVSLQHTGRHEFVRRYVSRLLPQGGLLGALLVGLAAPLVYLCVPWLLGPGYRGARQPLLLLLGSSWLLFVGALIWPLVIVQGKTRAAGAVSMFAALVNIIGDLLSLGVFRMGVTGPALATFASSLCLTYGNARIASRLYAVPLLRLSITAIPAVTSIALVLTLPTSAGLASAFAAACLSAALILRHASVVSPDDYEMFGTLGIPAQLVALARRTSR